MDHVAILRKANIKKGDNLLGDIISGTKTIESRWYVNKTAPWDKIKVGDTVYFKESGQMVTAKAAVSKVLQYTDLTPEIIEGIALTYGKQIAPNVSENEWMIWAKKQSKKRYCILVFLASVKKVQPFKVDKTGYGISSAWLVIKQIDTIKIG